LRDMRKAQEVSQQRFSSIWDLDPTQPNSKIELSNGGL